MLAAIMGTTAALGLWLLGVNYFYVLALITAAGEMVPVLGPFIAGAAAVAAGLAMSVHKGIYVLIFFVALQQLESNVLVPVIMEERVGLSPVTVIVALTIGFELSGIVGAILAVPTAAILKVLFDELMPEDRTSNAS
jgi:predicted PurR-regulated permease PerM